MILWTRPKLGHLLLVEALLPVRLAAHIRRSSSVPSCGLCWQGMTFPNVHRSTAAGQRNSRHVCVAPGRSCHTWVGDSAKHQHYRSGDGDCRYRDRFRAGSLRTHRAKSGPVAGDGNREARDLCSGSCYSRHGDRASRRPSILVSISHISCTASNQEHSVGRVGRLARPSILGILGKYHGPRQARNDLPLFPRPASFP